MTDYLFILPLLDASGSIVQDVDASLSSLRPIWVEDVRNETVLLSDECFTGIQLLS